MVNRHRMTTQKEVDMKSLEGTVRAFKGRVKGSQKNTVLDYVKEKPQR